MSVRMMSAAAMLVGVLVGGLRAAQDPADPRFVQALEKGDAAMKARRYQEAVDAYRQASSAAGKKSRAALAIPGRLRQSG